MYGTKDLEDVLNLLFSGVKGYVNASADGKIQLTDYIHFIPVITQIMPAISGIGNVGKEIMDLTPEELTRIEGFVKEKFDLPDPELVNRITHLFINALRFIGSASSLIRYGKDQAPV